MRQQTFKAYPQRCISSRKYVIAFPSLNGTVNRGPSVQMPETKEESLSMKWPHSTPGLHGPCGHITVQNVLSPTSRVPTVFLSLNTVSKTKLSFEISSHFLIASSLKSITSFQHTLAQNKRYYFKKGEKEMGYSKEMLEKTKTKI